MSITLFKFFKQYIPSKHTTIIIIAHLIGFLICIWIICKLPIYTFCLQVSIGLADVLIKFIFYNYNYILPILMLACSLNVILSKSPINSLISLIVVFFSMSLTLLSLQIEFIAMIFLIIYIGAIAILFLFVIMIFNLRSSNEASKPDDFYTSLYLFTFIIIPKFYFLACSSFKNYVLFNDFFLKNHKLERFIKYSEFFHEDNLITYSNHDILIFSEIFYTKHVTLFISLSFILLSAMIGAIVLALSTNIKTTY